MPLTTSNSTTVIFLSIFIIAFLPNIFIALVTSPLHLIASFRSTSKPSAQPTTYPPTMSSGWFQKQFTLPPKSRGGYLITDTVTKELPEIKQYKVGLLHLFVQHTSCALSLNENWDSDVREDMSDALDKIAPEDPKGDLYRHSAAGEGYDDMSAHIKSSLIGSSGIWYLEFRAAKHTRKLVATIQGEKKA